MGAWDSGADYDRFMGRWSRLLAARFLEWLNVPAGRSWLDVGCGTGALLGLVHRTAAPGRLSGVDPSPAFVETARTAYGEVATIEVGDAQDLPFADDSTDVTVSALVLNFVPDAARAVREMRRVTAPRGQVALYVWDYAEGMEMLRVFWDAAAQIRSDIRHLDEAEQFPLCHPIRLQELFEAGGLADVETAALHAQTTFSTFDEYWSPFELAQGPAGALVASLSAEQRQALRERLRERLGDGPISLSARAWAIRGVA